MKVLSILHVPNKTILTLDGDILKQNASKVIVNGKEYDFDIAYDMDNTIGISKDNLNCEEVFFVWFYLLQCFSLIRPKWRIESKDILYNVNFQKMFYMQQITYVDFYTRFIHAY